MTKLSKYEDILNASSEITKKTYHMYGKELQKYAEAINLLIKIVHNATNSDFYKSSNNNPYIDHVLQSYYDLPISFRACISLMEQGLYIEAIKLIRSLLENLVKIKYFHKNQIHFKDFEKSEKYITFSKMFKVIGANNAYNKIYKELSRIMHSNLGTKNARLNQFLLETSDIQLIPIFNDSFVKHIMYSLMYIFYGYLNFAEKLFVYDKSIDDQSIKFWLNDQILKHKKRFPEAAEWSNAMNEIIY